MPREGTNSSKLLVSSHLEIAYDLIVETNLFRAQEPKAPVNNVFTRWPLSVRPSSVRQFTFSTSSLEPLDLF